MPPQTISAQCESVKQNTSFTGQDVFVPVVRPSHTTNVYQKNYKYMYSFPHAAFVVCQETHKNGSIKIILIS
ncbi:CotD family spore coat protein [Priestia megaterium]|uniref:CotD family spore coat protein n=1 Tax=Priestia megaterium TaxID=1404 RepID=UPI00101E1436